MSDYDRVEFVEPKEDKRYEAKIWWAIAGIGFVILFFTVYNHVKALNLYFNGTCIEVDYQQGAGRVNFKDEKGQLYSVNIVGYSLNVKDGKIKLYYKDDIAKALPINSAKTWILGYGASIILLALGVWRIVVIYKEPDYTIEQEKY